MSRSKFLILMSLVLTVAIVAWSFGDALAQKTKVTKDEVYKKFGKVTPSEQKAAIERAKKLGLKPGVAGLGPRPVPFRFLRVLAGYRIISAPTATGLSARFPGAPSSRSRS